VVLRPDGRRPDRHGAGRIVRRTARRAGIGKQAGPRTLRHAFITAALDAGCRCGTCRTPPRMPTRGPPRGMTGHRRPWTGTPPASPPPTPPEPPADPRSAPERRPRQKPGPGGAPAYSTCHRLDTRTAVLASRPQSAGRRVLSADRVVLAVAWQPVFSAGSRDFVRTGLCSSLMWSGLNSQTVSAANLRCWMRTTSAAATLSAVSRPCVRRNDDLAGH
jgi:hypothetical protein